MTRMKRRTMMMKRRRGLVMTMKSWRGMVMMVMMTWSNIAKSGNAPLSSSCVNIDLGQFQIKRGGDINGPTKIRIDYTEFKLILTYSPSN